MRFGLRRLFFCPSAMGSPLWRVGRKNFQGDPTLRRDAMWFGFYASFGPKPITDDVHIWGAIYGFRLFRIRAGLWDVGRGT